MSDWRVLLAVHFFLAFIFVVLSARKKLKLTAPMMVVVVLVPYCGELLGLVEHIMIVSGRSGRDSSSLEEDEEEDEEISQTRVGRLPSETSPALAAPLQDVLQTGDVSLGRAVVKGILFLDPLQYTVSLMLACSNHDSETAHYAASELLEISRSYDARLRRLGTEYRSDTASHEALENYISGLEDYVDSGIVEEEQMRKQNRELKSLLEKSYKADSNADDGIRLAQTVLDENNTWWGGRIIDSLAEKYPDDDRVWLLQARLAFMTNDTEHIDELVAARQEKIEKGIETAEAAHGEADGTDADRGDVDATDAEMDADGTGSADADGMDADGTGSADADGTDGSVREETALSQAEGEAGEAGETEDGAEGGGSAGEPAQTGQHSAQHSGGESGEEAKRRRQSRKAKHSARTLLADGDGDFTGGGDDSEEDAQLQRRQDRLEEGLKSEAEQFVDYWLEMRRTNRADAAKEGWSGDIAGAWGAQGAAKVAAVLDTKKTVDEEPQIDDEESIAGLLRASNAIRAAQALKTTGETADAANAVNAVNEADMAKAAGMAKAQQEMKGGTL